MLASLVDPGSAEFGPTRTLPSGIVCGSVNARNRMGGYAGRSPWYFDPRTGTAYVIPAAQNAFGQAWDARQFQRLGCPSGLEHWLSNRELMKLVDEKP